MNIKGFITQAFSIVVFVAWATPGFSQSTKKMTAENQQVLSYGKKGFEFNDASGNYYMHLEFRGQFRAAYPYDTNPLTFTDFENDQLHLGIRRARMKVGGHAYKTWMKYYLEYEMQGSALLDFRLMFDKYRGFKVKVGQWKVQYNRERIVSSGKQQTVERSILTKIFTLDRQQGVSVYGNLGKENAANFNYWLSIFEGEGRGNFKEPNSKPMVMTRLQWNPNGSPLEFTGSDTEYHKTFKSLFAVGAVSNESRFTRFSTSGGGSLEGFTHTADDKYRINQLLQESAGKYRGFSWQQEIHYKNINDLVRNKVTEMTGYLVQMGYVFQPKESRNDYKYEVFARNAMYIPDFRQMEQQQDEYTLGLNMFMAGHRNKLTLEGAYLSSNYHTTAYQNGMRVRLQWDVSF